MAWYLPSYGRPARLAELLAAAQMPADLWIILTADDHKLDGYFSMANLFWRSHSIAPANSRVGDIIRWLFARWPADKFYGVIGDDHWPMTKDCWEKLEEAAADRYIAVSAGGAQGTSIIGGGGVCLGGGLARAMGGLAPAGFRHNYIDNVWNDVGRDFGLIKLLPDVVVEHRHWTRGTAKPDMTYVRGSSDLEEDGKIYQAWQQSPEKAAMYERVAEFLKS